MGEIVLFGAGEPLRKHTSLRTLHTLFFDASHTIQDRIAPVPNQPRLQYEDRTLPTENIVEHLDYTVVRPENTPDPVKVALIGGLHANEAEAPQIASELFVKKDIPRIEAWNVNVAAGMLGTRGWVRPVVDKEIVPEMERAQMKNSRQVLWIGHEGRKIDLNRQFPIPEDAKSWGDVYDALSYPEAKLLTKMMQDNPDIQYTFVFHEDPRWGGHEQATPGVEQLGRDGFYFYDVARDARTDRDKQIIDGLKTNLSTALTDEGFSLFHGVDDPTDPALGYVADHGYIYQPNVDEKGVRKLDGTFESAIVEFGRLGLSNIDRAFTFEVPGKLTSERKTQMIEIITNTFITPFLVKKGVVQGIEQALNSGQELQEALYELTAMVASGAGDLADDTLIKRVDQLMKEQKIFDEDMVLRIGFLHEKTRRTPNESGFTALFSQLSEKQQQWYTTTSKTIKKDDPRLHPQRGLWK